MKKENNQFSQSHSSLDLLGAIITMVPVEALHRFRMLESNTYWPKLTKFRLRQYEPDRKFEILLAKIRLGKRNDIRKNSSEDRHGQARELDASRVNLSGSHANMCRYEFQLPVRFNDGPPDYGAPVPKHLIREAVVAIRARFGGVSSEKGGIWGEWEDEGLVYSQDNVRIFCDVTDSPENLASILDFKKRFERDLRQKVIYVVKNSIKVL